LVTGRVLTRRLGTGWLGTGRLGTGRLGTGRLGTGRLGTGRPGGRLGAARLASCWLVGGSGRLCHPGRAKACRGYVGLVVGEEVPPGLVNRLRVGQVTLVELVHEPLVRAEISVGVRLVGLLPIRGIGSPWFALMATVIC
jgi:ATP-binding cassette subfamily B (MDR/TAP) protein 1